MEAADSNTVTRQRLLEVAGEVFAEKGFREATVREICRRAEANVAAVNYHFGDKEQLYRAAVRYAADYAKRFPIDEGLPPYPTPEQRLRGFVRAFLLGILEAGKPAWHAKLIAREIADPTNVLDEIAEHGVRPRVAALFAILRPMVGERVPQAVLHRCVRSIVGQMLFYHFARPMLVRVFRDERFDASTVEELTDHVWTFSLAGVRAIAERYAQDHEGATGAVDGGGNGASEAHGIPGLRSAASRGTAQRSPGVGAPEAPSPDARTEEDP